jgi:hypothetical protein
MIHRATRRYPSYCCGDGESEERVYCETSDLKPQRIGEKSIIVE